MYRCARPNQSDWAPKVPKLLEILESIINFPKSGSPTSYESFIQNFVCIPWIRITTWASATRASASAMKCSPICDSVSALRKRLTTLKSALDSVMTVHIKLDQTRDTNQGRRVVPFKLGDLAYVSQTVMTHQCYRKVVNDFGNTHVKLDSDDDSLFCLKSCGVREIFHASALHIHATIDSLLFSGLTDAQVAQLNSTNDLDGNFQSVDCIRTQARSKLEMDTVINIKWTSEDDSKSCAFTLVTSTCPTLPAFPSMIIFSYLLTIYETFTSPFLRLFQPSLISPIVNLEPHCLHQPYAPIVVVDHRQPAPFYYPTQRRDFIISLRYHFVTTMSPISSTLDRTTVDECLQINTGVHTRLNHSITINTRASIETNYSANGSVNHHPNSFGHSSTTEIIDEHSPMEVSNCKSDAHLVYPRKMIFTTQPLVPHLKRMILIIHTNSSMIPCPPTLNSLSLFRSTRYLLKKISFTPPFT